MISNMMAFEFWQITTIYVNDVVIYIYTVGFTSEDRGRDTSVEASPPGSRGRDMSAALAVNTRKQFF